MHRSINAKATLCCALLMALHVSRPSAAQTYTYHDVGPAYDPGHYGTRLVNNSGQVAGSVSIGSTLMFDGPVRMFVLEPNP